MKIIFTPHIGDIYELVDKLPTYTKWSHPICTIPANTKFVIGKITGTAFNFSADKKDWVRLELNFWGEKVWVYFTFLNSNNVRKIEQEQ